MSRPYFNVKSLYTGTGSLSAYTFDFKITLLEQIRIVIADNNNDVVENIRGDEASTYIDNISGYEDQDIGGGTVNLLAPLPAGYKMVLLLEDPEPSQDFEFRNKTSFKLKIFEDALDRIVGSIQGFVLKTRQGLRISVFDDETSFDPELPPGIADNGNKVIAVNDRGTGFQFGPTIEQISSAAQAALDAIAAKEASEAAAVVSTDASLEAQTILFDGEVILGFADSPVNFDSGVFNSKIVRIDATLGNVVINLQQLSNYPDGFKAQYIRTDTDPTHSVTIVPYAGETIDHVAPYVLSMGSAVIMSKDLNDDTNWVKRFIGITSGGGSVPAGGIDGDYLEVLGGVLGFTTGVFTGFSARYGQALNIASLRDALLYIFQFQYLGALVSLGASGSGTLREKGAAVTSSTLTASVTKRSTAISRIQFFLNGVSVNDNNPPAQTGTGNTIFVWTGSFTDNSTFRVDVTDTTDGTNGPTTVQSSVNFTFVYPYYWKNGASGLTAAQVAVLSGAKQVQNNTNSQVVTFTVTAGEKVYFQYPAAYGALTSIKDQNGFEALGSFTASTENVVGLDGTTQSYRKYVLNNPIGVSGSTTYTFIK